MVNIKQLVIAGLAALSLLASTFAAPAAAAENTVKVADGVYSYVPGEGYTSMFVVTSDGVVAVEPVNTKHAKGMLKAIRSVTQKPVRYLIHTHNHWDHSSGGKIFREAGARILAHKEPINGCRQILAAIRCSPMKAGTANEKISSSATKP